MKMKKTVYNIEYNPVSKTWCLYKNIEGSQSLNFYPIVQSVDKKDCQAKLDEINAHLAKGYENRQMARHKRKGLRALYNLYLNDELIDTDTKDNLVNKYKDLKHNEFYPSHFYKRRLLKYRVEKVKNND